MLVRPADNPRRALGFFCTVPRGPSALCRAGRAGPVVWWGIRQPGERAVMNGLRANGSQALLVRIAPVADGREAAGRL